MNGVLLRVLPYAEPERLVMVWETDRDSDTEREGTSVPDYFDFRERARSFDHLAAFQITPMNRTGDGEPERVATARVSAEFFATLGSAPLMGRDFLEAEMLHAWAIFASAINGWLTSASHLLERTNTRNGSDPVLTGFRRSPE